MNSRFFRVVLIPAAVFQSVIFGGAYGTGREIAEFVSRHGPGGGLLALLIIMFGFGLILAISFELARVARVYDYRGFMKVLVGRGWVAFECLFLAGLLLVLAVNGSAAGTILHDQFSVPALLGSGLLFAIVVVLSFLGREFLTKSMAFWMTALTIILVILFVESINQRGAHISQVFAAELTTGNWFTSGLQYTLYNAAVIPILLYCARDIDTRAKAIGAGFFAGAMGAFPALVFHMLFMSAYPEVLNQEIPTYWMIDKLEVSWLMIAYILVLFGMIIQTVAGLLHGLIERVDVWYDELRQKPLDRWVHALITAFVLLLGLLLSKLGIIALVAQGYGNLAWGYLVIYVIPLLTVGLYRIVVHPTGQG